MKRKITQKAQAAADKQRKNSGKKMPVGKPFQPGQSGNPAGRPKGVLFLSEAYRRQLSQPFPGDPHERTFAEVIAEQVCLTAAGGDFHAAKEIADRTEGRARQAIDVTLSKSESDKYEAMVDRLMASAASKGAPLTRAEAVQYLATFDRKILVILNQEGEQ